ncbi:MAG TPA: cytochrome c oxidase subunit I [Acetobacteraceae bacterium]|nr:cytochrome c oxidase subunit I [Acetobacteraceae bacterium]
MIPAEPRGVRDTDLPPAALDAAMARIWDGPAGFWGWMTSVDHKSIGRRYIVTAFGFLLLAGVLAVLIRAQLAWPGQRLLDPDLYNQVFTMHGTTMMFLFAVPVMEAFGVYLVPLMLGTRVIAFPRLNAYSYWVYLFGGVMLWAAFLTNVGPDVGWFSYVPLAGPEYAPGKRADYWAQLITFTEIAALATSVELIVTFFKQRAPGMQLNRIPIFSWAMLVTSFCIVFAMPAVVIASSMLISDRLVGTHFYNPAEGGDPLLYQHLFWFFGHPEVYIIFLPTTGMAAMIVETAARRPMVGYAAVVLSLVSIGFLSFGLWVHHMFATGLPRLGNSFFTASSMAIAIPTGLQIFCWIATLWDGKVRVSTPLLFVVAFMVVFVLGGLSGVMIASVPFDLQATDTYFIVGHIHLVLLGGAVAPLVGGVYHWFPKLTGRMLDERLGRLNFWLYLVGVLLAFVPMLALGLRGMTRRIYTYPPDLGWSDLNLLASVGGVLIALSFAVLALNAALALRRPRTAPDNPWDAATLEWATASPPPSWNFAHIPVVTGRAPLWENPAGLPYATGLRVDVKEILVTTGVDAIPELREPVPRNSIWPFLCAVVTTVMLIGSIYTPSAVWWGAIPVGIALVGWLWPRHTDVPLRPGEIPS